MRQFNLLESATTRHLFLTAGVIVIGVPTLFALILALDIVNIDLLATFVDAAFKTTALIVGAVWALNRYFVTRTDAPQLRVESEVSYIHAKSFLKNPAQRALLIFRLDIFNTGKTLIKPFQEYVEVQAIMPGQDTVEYVTVWRWPPEGMHPGNPIEPGSWSAINAEVSIPPTVQAIRIFLGIQLTKQDSWSWHKTFDLLKL